ncbi:MAG: hypothetical protein QOI41_2671, partial [Myxococcales bacterium]|nr:hypothetical protein [Myxococcales bacterium]
MRSTPLALWLSIAAVAAHVACKDAEPLGVVVAPTTSSPPQVNAAHRISLSLHDLRITTGHVVELSSGRLHVTDPKTRFVATGTPASAEMRFIYRGPTLGTTALASGEMRRQLGLKLRARDGCNVVYAIWRIEPESKLVVSVKRNEGATTHEDCGAGGYENITPARSAAIPALLPNESHLLAARIDGTRMRVTIDAREVWEGELPQEAFTFNGPAGVRTD